MRITILTLFPEMFQGFFDSSIIKKARYKGLVDYQAVDIRSFTLNKHNRVDDYPFGGGQGMIMFPQPVIDALNSVRTEKSHVIMMTPAAPTFTQKKARQLAADYEDIILICAHYEGYDERILDYCDEVLSIGDYILTGGEVASMVITDALTRLVPGVITEDSTLYESFENGLLEHPQYTRPVEYDGKTVPEILLSGHHENIRRFNLKASLAKTLKYRPDLLEKRDLSAEEKDLLKEIEEESVTAEQA